jgi:hypothetical protein
MYAQPEYVCTRGRLCIVATEARGAANVVGRWGPGVLLVLQSKQGICSPVHAAIVGAEGACVLLHMSNSFCWVQYKRPL